eukprot:1188313-Prorocentrum_minimum.AAC.1
MFRDVTLSFTYGPTTSCRVHLFIIKLRVLGAGGGRRVPAGRVAESAARGGEIRQGGGRGGAPRA